MSDEFEQPVELSGVGVAEFGRSFGRLDLRQELPDLRPAALRQVHQDAATVGRVGIAVRVGGGGQPVDHTSESGAGEPGGERQLRHGAAAVLVEVGHHPPLVDGHPRGAQGVAHASGDDVVGAREQIQSHSRAQTTGIDVVGHRHGHSLFQSWRRPAMMGPSGILADESDS